MSDTRTSPFRDIRRQFSADPRKTKILIGLAALMAIIWGRLLIKDAPRRAAAGAVEIMPDLLVTPPAGDAPTPAARSGGPPNQASAGGGQLPRQTVDIAGAARELARDPFSADWSLFAEVDPVPQSRQAAPKLSIWEQARAVAREKKDRERRRVQAVTQAATALSVQSTMIGAQPMAVINGRTCRPGDEIAGFELVRVLPRQVVIRKEGVTTTLSLP